MEDNFVGRVLLLGVGITQLNVGFLFCSLDDKEASTSSTNSVALSGRIPAEC